VYILLYVEGGNSDKTPHFK